MPKQPAKIESLDDLIAQGEHYGEFCMRGTGRITPALFLIGSEGPLIFVPESLANESAKDDFATKARLVCIANAATACVMVLEAWAKFAKPNEKLDLTAPPSEAFDRQEFVILMGEGPGAQRQKFLPIIRSGNGKFFGFGEPNDPGADNMTGRFAQILPPKAPDAAIREIAKAMLKVQGVAPHSASTPLRLDRAEGDRCLPSSLDKASCVKWKRTGAQALPELNSNRFVALSFTGYERASREPNL